MSVVIDTHVLAWSLIAPDLLPERSVRALKSGATVFVPPCALHEITLKVRRGKWDAMKPHADRLDALCAAQGFAIAPYTARMAMMAGGMDWEHCDPFDRMIAATACEMGGDLISRDSAFDAMPALAGWKGRLWA